MAVVNGVQQLGSWVVKCCYCGEPVAVLSNDEMLPFMMWLTDKAEIVSCFTCDPVGADLIPKPLLQSVFEPQVVVVDENGLKTPIWSE